MSGNARCMELTSWELLVCYMVASGQGGTVGNMKVWWNILDILEPDDNEKKELGWDVDAGSETTIVLDPKHFDVIVEIELSESYYKKMANALKNYPRWTAGGMIGGHRDRVRALFNKFGIED